MPVRTSPPFVGLLLASVLASSCGASGEQSGTLATAPDTVTVIDNGLHYWPAASWRSTAADRVGIDSRVLSAVADRIGKSDFNGVHAMLVIRHGYLVAERYASSSSAADVHTLQSVSKSVTSLLIGIARDEGKLTSIDAPLLGFFPEYDNTVANVDNAKRTLTVRHLLSMRTGMSFWEEPYAGSPLEQLNSCNGCDWLKLILDRPMTEMPGLTWKYNSGGVIALGGVLYSTTGVSASEYARQKLFTPLGITQWQWYAGNPHGLPHMGGGLSLRAQDLARIGYLVLRHGLWNEQRIVSQAWLDSSTSRVTTQTENYFPRGSDYGMLWWLFPRNGQLGATSGNDYIVAASGTGGQWMFLDPKNDLIVVFTGSTSIGLSWPPFTAFFNEILPAVQPQ